MLFSLFKCMQLTKSFLPSVIRSSKYLTELVIKGKTLHFLSLFFIRFYAQRSIKTLKKNTKFGLDFQLNLCYLKGQVYFAPGRMDEAFKTFLFLYFSFCVIHSAS